MSIYMSKEIFWYCVCLAFVLGAVFGSFLNCCADRLTHGLSVVHGRSVCSSCGHVLGVVDLVPVLSWIGLKGKCRYCGEKIPVGCVLSEVFLGLMFVVLLLKFDLSLECLRNMILTCCLFCLSLVDLEDMWIPDGCLLVALGAWLAFLPFIGVSKSWIFEHLGSGIGLLVVMLLISMLMDRILGKESMGGGDIKLFGIMGLYLGLVGSLFGLLLSCVVGLVFALCTKSKNRAFPFGPSIALATYVMLVFGSGLVSWYMGLLGL